MKLEQLAVLLSKDPAELSSTLNLEVSVDVPEDILTRELTNFHKEIGVTKFNEGKKQGEGMAKRLVMTEAEKTLKETFGIDGKDFNEIVENLKGLKSDGKPDEKLKSELDKWKQTALSKDNEIASLKSEFEKIQTTEKLKSSILPKLDKFEFATAKVREVAINEFLNTKKFKIEGSDIFLERNDNTFVTLSDSVIDEHFKEFGTIKANGKTNTPPRTQTQTSYGKTASEILKAIDNAKTPEELQDLRQQLASLEE